VRDRIDVGAARELARGAFAAAGLPVDAAGEAAAALVETSLMGIDTHGLRLLPLYVTELLGGRSNPAPRLRFTRLRAGAARLDADDALGIVAGLAGARRAAELAEASGVGLVSVARSNHFGAASVYGLEMARRGCLALVMTHAAPRVAPYGGVAPLFGTNPICFVAPRRGATPFCLDMATSQISYSLVKHHRAEGTALPPGCCVDAAGAAVTDPEQVAALAPLGGYKGQGLAMVVQILCALLADMPLDWELSDLDREPFDTGRRIAHFLLAIDVRAFGDAQGFDRRLGALLDAVRAASARPGERVQVAGDPQWEIRRDRLAHGIPLHPRDRAALAALTARLGLPPLA
jgi:ureidoglycolate dehydrogenase (NAD+)